ncbi:MAG: DMT family transporter [Pyrinomonadaceae bacterium]
MRNFLLTSFALTAFAFNSILCRLALRGDEIDAASFTAVRLVSGAIMLIVISFIVTKGRRIASDGSWLSAGLLFGYAVCFSFAYLGLSAGTGALILFGSVQLTVIVNALAGGERPKILEWLGLLTAIAGLVYLVFPGLASPPLYSSALMAAAGMAWGMYTVRGRSAGGPLRNTTGNFVRTIPFAAVVAIVFLSQTHLSNRGVMLAVLSGSIASGIGYTIWYMALKYHTSTRAAVLQLVVPVITAVGGILILGEAATLRLGLAAALILGGIMLSIFGRKVE